MNLTKSESRGKPKYYYNSINGILFGKCNDNNVVSFISTVVLVGNESTTQQYGSENIIPTSFSTECVL